VVKNEFAKITPSLVVSDWKSKAVTIIMQNAKIVDNTG
jgi:hypothetical protein